MTSKKPRKRPAPPLCAEIHEDDGVDPRAFFRAGRTGRKAGRKTLQLCSQVQNALDYLLTGDSHDELLALFRVVEGAEPVDPAAYQHRMHRRGRHAEPATELDRAEPVSPPQPQDLPLDRAYRWQCGRR